MKNYNICIKTALAVFAVALSACSSDDDIADNNSNSQEKPVTNKTMTFRATMDDGSGSNSKATRTDFNGNNTIWAANDKIYILNILLLNKFQEDNNSNLFYQNLDINLPNN